MIATLIGIKKILERTPRFRAWVEKIINITLKSI